MRTFILLVLCALAAGIFAKAQPLTQPGQLALATVPANPPLSRPKVEVLALTAPKSEPLITAASRAESHRRYLWIASMASLAGASAADAATSWGKREGNGLLASADGTFGVRGVMIKAGLAGAALVPQALLRKHRELRSKFLLANFVETGIFTGVALHNIRVTAAAN